MDILSRINQDLEDSHALRVRLAEALEQSSARLVEIEKRLHDAENYAAAVEQQMSRHGMDAQPMTHEHCISEDDLDQV